MKTKYIITALFLSFVFIACDKDIENIGYDTKRDVDYEALRAYKATDHEYMFGWFGGWNGGGASMSTALRSLPDSMDLVSIWGEWKTLSDGQKADMKFVQEVKGTKIVACIFTPAIGAHITPTGEDPKAYWGWVDGDADSQEAAIRKYGDALAKFILDLGYDGVDMDNEIESGNIYGNTRLTSAFIETMGQYMGPASGTGKLFCIDGSLTTGTKAESDQHVNFYIAQAYSSSSASSFDSGISTLVNKYGKTRTEMAKKYIPACDFELQAPTGGGTFTERNGNKTSKAEGFAGYKPLDEDGNEIMKGGSGMYHIENDYKNTPYDYYYTRRAIQIMNPAKTTKKSSGE